YNLQNREVTPIKTKLLKTKNFRRTSTFNKLTKPNREPRKLLPKKQTTPEQQRNKQKEQRTKKKTPNTRA
ncbi:MAG: hypothetical protein KGZ97_01305, partial [Bacteroidetes bacterium]|nr:hypothetical protein [Bacteroidota bacterium]